MNILEYASHALVAVCDDIYEEYDVPSGAVELLLIELLTWSLVQEAPEQAAKYLQVLAEEMPKPDFDKTQVNNARDEMLAALA